ncbi:MAG: hypothetical protein GVY27_02470 [Deinococcus-Thermus bacterium]|nr:hypothetical protein [Deinococcota bacterium]
MTQPALWLLSLQAFGAVVVLLAALALAVQALTWLFRAPPAPASSATPAPAAPGAERSAPDPTVAVAVQAAAQRVRPGARVVRIEEVP